MKFIIFKSEQKNIIIIIKGRDITTPKENGRLVIMFLSLRYILCERTQKIINIMTWAE